MSRSHTPSAPPRVNGLDLAALTDVVQAVEQDPKNALACFTVKNTWRGQARSEARVESYRLGGQEIPRPFTFPVDEPLELLGTNTAPNPQELLMAALNACVLFGYVANAAVMGVTLEDVEVESSGEIDLRGFLGLSEDVNPGYDRIHTVVRVRGDGTPEQMREIHETVRRTSPNVANLARAVPIESELVVL